MFTLLRTLSPRALLIEQLPVLILTLIIAELFFKFRSFTLECIAFLVTWYVLDGMYSTVRRRLSPDSGAARK